MRTLASFCHAELANALSGQLHQCLMVAEGITGISFNRGEHGSNHKDIVFLDKLNVFVTHFAPRGVRESRDTGSCRIRQVTSFPLVDNHS
jgi:hypothetical protein